MEKKSINLKLVIKNIGSISNKLGAIDSKEISLEGNVFDFLVHYKFY